MTAPLPGGFTEADYERIRDGSRYSADVICPLLLEAAGGYADRVIDVGCGEGWFGRRLHELGVPDVVGIDSGPAPADLPIRWVEHDLTVELPRLERADLVVCLEVGEHLPPARAESFVAEVCQLGPLIAWSAAIPGQGGHLHVNERWQRYWASLFEWHGFGVLDWRARIWDDERVEPWYRQNLLLFVEAGGDLDPPMLDVVHPEIFGWRVAEARG